jgi:outer membrane beta-barrel protein
MSRSETDEGKMTRTTSVSKHWISVAIAAACLIAPGVASAQKKGGKKPPAAPAATAKPAAGAGPTDGGDIDAKPADATGAAGASGAAGDGTAAPADGAAPATPAPDAPAGVGGGICDIDPSACPKGLDLKSAAKKEVGGEVFAVQQIYALKRNRLELNPYWAFSLNDQFVSHPGPGLALNFYFSNVLAVGINGTYYGGLNSDSSFNFENRRSARIAVPLNEYLVGANLNVTYVPVYGKFASLADFIFHYDMYTVFGAGTLVTRPIPVIDPDNRKFDWTPKLAFNAGVGMRIFINRWIAATLELRALPFLEKVENIKVGKTTAEQVDPKTFFGDNSTKFTIAVQTQLGLSFFIPPSWEYRLAK